MEIVIIIGYRKLFVICNDKFREVIIKVNFFICVRLKLYCMVVFKGCFVNIIFIVLKKVCFRIIVNVMIMIGIVYLIIIVGFIIILIDIKKIVLNKFFIGFINWLIDFVLIVLVRIDFIMKVLKVVEKLVLVVIVIILK